MYRCIPAISCQSVLTEALLLSNGTITHKYPESMSGTLTIPRPFFRDLVDEKILLCSLT